MRAPLDPVDTVHRLADLGAYGVNFHDDDLVPHGSSPAEREAIVKRFRRALDATGLKVPMATTNLFSHPVFKDGAFTANDPAVRRYALAKTLEAIDLGVELGATVFVMWGGREGVECDAAKDVRTALDRYAEAVDLLCQYVIDRGYDLRFALEPKPNEPRGDMFLPTVGHALAFINELEWPDMVGLNPEFAHETMSGLSFHHGVAQALWPASSSTSTSTPSASGSYDQDFRFGSEGIRDAFYLVKLLEDAGLGRHAPLRRPRLSHRGRRRRVGVRPGLHAHLPHPAAEGRAVPYRSRDRRGAGGRQGRSAERGHSLADGDIAGLRRVRRVLRSRRWPRRATATSASTNWSPSCFSECAGARSRLVVARPVRDRRRGPRPSGRPLHPVARP